MSDIWSGIGVNIAGDQGEWLYRVGGEMRGPLSKQQLVDKLLRGDIALDTPVAREGGEFHPIGRVAAFAEHLTEAQKLLAIRTKKRRAKIIWTLLLVVAAAGVAGGFALHQDYQRRLAEREQAAAKAEQEAKKKAEALSAVPRMKLVALVSLGTEQDVTIRSQSGKKKKKVAKKRRSSSGKPGGKPSDKPAQAEESFVSQCMLSKGDIFGTLRRHLGKLNVCVEDEKGRDKQGLLPPTLQLEFVVKNNGTVVDFAIDNRHFRRGPMNNCMIKAFRTIRFPASKGANCPVTIPINLGKN